jgi:hypothetical protein
MPEQKRPRPPSTPQERREERAQRLAAALRENLKRRKDAGKPGVKPKKD